MKTKFYTSVTLLITLIVLLPLNSFAQRDPKNRIPDDRLKNRLPIKEETNPRERPREKEKNPPLQNSDINNPPYYNPTPPHYHPEPGCFVPPPQRPNPHLPKTPEIIITDYKLSGIEKFKDGDYETALEYLRNAIIEDSNDYELYYYKGMAEIKLQLYEDALKDLDYFLEYIIHDPDGYFQRGLAKFYLGEKEEAKDDFQIAADMDHKLAISILKRFY